MMMMMMMMMMMTRALLSCSLRVDICNCCFVMLGEINDDDDGADAVANPKCHLMPTMIISGGGMSGTTPASYFVHNSFTLQFTVAQVRPSL